MKSCVRMRGWLGGWLLAAGILGGCADPMVDQRKLEAYEPRRGRWIVALPDLPPSGAVAVGSDSVPRPPFTADAALFALGRTVHDVHCAPCHGVTGVGDGEVVRRGFPRPRSYHLAALREASDAALHEVVADGRGSMVGFSELLDPRERWAAVAWIRALQRAWSVPVDRLADAERRQLDSGAAGGRDR